MNRKEIKKALVEYGEAIEEINKIAREQEWEDYQRTALKEMLDESLLKVLHAHLFSDIKEFARMRVDAIKAVRDELKRREFDEEEVREYTSAVIASTFY